MMDAKDRPVFPPPLLIGARVWTAGGYPDHGPMDGPKVSILGCQGGTVQMTAKPYLTMDQLLYTVRWDNGQISKHYANGLFCIGRFTTVDDFRAAIVPHERVELTLGPKGGFREATIPLTYDGVAMVAHLQQHDRGLWSFMEPIIASHELKVTEHRLPPSDRRKPTAQQHMET